MQDLQGQINIGLGFCDSYSLLWGVYGRSECVIAVYKLFAGVYSAP